MEDHDVGPDDMPESVWISEARRLAASVAMMLDHPRMKAVEGESGLYRTAREQAEGLLYLVQKTETCSDAEEFDVLLYLIRCDADGLAWTLSLLRIPS